MYEVDKQKFGAFVAQLRKEKGYTQKDLAEKLFISDKAISKWETGVSIPDVGLLIPLSEIMGVTVTELLKCQRLEEPLNPVQVEDIVKKAIAYSDESPQRTRQEKVRGALIYFGCLAVACLEVAALYFLNYPVNYEYLLLIIGFGIGFGYYFMFAAKHRLPGYYDEHRINGMIDGPFRMNIPGVRFTNNNWPYIVKCGQIWSMAIMVVYPALTLMMQTLVPEAWPMYEMYVLMVLILGRLFVPMVIVGRKYE